MAIRWGICSAGKISHDFTVALRTLPSEDHQVVAVAARDLKNAQEFAEKHGILRAYASYEELAKDSEIDVVYIGTIHPYHLKAGLLFMNCGKPVLIEKPLAMNAKEVKELVAAAKKNNVFMMEALWTRFFPVSAALRRSLAQDEVGEVMMVRADLGAPLSHIPRMAERDLGGGALLDIGVYCLQFVLMVYNGERPESIQATGYKLDTGVDGHAVVVLKFSRNRMAVCTCSMTMMLTNDAVIVGSKGMIKVPDHMWCPINLDVNGKVSQHPLPEPPMPLNFTHSAGLRYEAQEVRECLLKGLKESPVMSLSDSTLLAELLDEARKQVGVTYNQDK
ncbi:trans-1,2-dihydrobenzene-1,2-diol dehydrogenase [Chanos chanos]|uniref:Trans-1,2-dihydrobenzene-1,2-diol dehydrogenase n=1 Tax=Chanos chanos TaxID=29144 RepID=A0A6J2W991_CHACN|nr:trans-1,2-dihydrobenzene-1,2-diol dehydrogenase-like [Chanos chanos]